MSEERIRTNGCAPANAGSINCHDISGDIPVCNVNPDIIRCDLVTGAPIHQLTKYCEEEGEDKKIYPISLIQAIFDGRTGTRLDVLLGLCNAIYVTYEGDFEHTVSKIQNTYRRKGLIVTYRDITNTTSTIRYTNEDVSDIEWNNPDNWEGWSFDTLQDDLRELIETIFRNINDYSDVYNALLSACTIAVSDVFTNINNYPDLKTAIINAIANNLASTLEDIFTNINSYPGVLNALKNAISNWLDDLFGNLSNYPELLTTVENTIKNIFENIYDYDDLRLYISDAIDRYVIRHFNWISCKVVDYNSNYSFDDYNVIIVPNVHFNNVYEVLQGDKLCTIRGIYDDGTVGGREIGGIVSVVKLDTVNSKYRYDFILTVDTIKDNAANVKDFNSDFSVIKYHARQRNDSDYDVIGVRYTMKDLLNGIVGVPDGICPLDSNGKIDAQYFDLTLGGRVPIVEFSNSTLAVDPNKYYKQDNTTPMDSFDLTLNAPIAAESGFLAHYMIDVYLSATGAAYLGNNLPTGVGWSHSDVPAQAGHYQISIINGIASYLFV